MRHPIFAYRLGSQRALWIGATVALIALWFVVYWQLPQFSDWAAAHLPVAPGSHLEEAAKFFVYDTPKVLMLLTLVVFGMGVVRSFFSPERTRALLAGKREGIGNVAAAGLGVFTPFCSCSAVPLFVGFVSAGVPLGVTFSFLIAAPMVNEVALGLLFALVGWKVALTYLAFGLGDRDRRRAGSSVGCISKAGLRNGCAMCARAPPIFPSNRSDGRRPHQSRHRGGARHRRPGLDVDHRRHRRRRLHPWLRAERPSRRHHGQGHMVVGAGRRSDRHTDVFQRRGHHSSGRRCWARAWRSAPCSPS